MPVQLYSSPIRWIEPDRGPIDGLTSRTNQSSPVFKTLLKDKNWREAMVEEMSALKKNNTWEIVDPPTREKQV